MNIPFPADLVCFDVDGTLVRHPSGRVIWEVLNDRFVGDHRVNELRYRQFKAGEITYEQWVELDVQGWIDTGAIRDQFLECAAEFEPSEGALETIDELVDRGKRLAIVSGSLDFLIHELLPVERFVAMFSNQLLFDDTGRLNGWRATPFDQSGKAAAVRLIAQQQNVPLEKCAFVGDGANDVSVAGVTGCLIAFNPQSAELEKVADHVIRDNDIRSLLRVIK